MAPSPTWYYKPTPTRTPIQLPTLSFTPSPTLIDKPTPTETQLPLPTLTVTPSPTYDFTPSPTSTPVCSDPLPVDGELPDGYVWAVDPDNGSSGFPISNERLVIYYNQQMKSDGGSGSVRWPGAYVLTNMSNGNDVDVLNRVYDPDIFQLTLRLNLSDRDWQPGTLYQLKILGSIQNICGTPQGEDVTVTFTTASDSKH
jgi:hypothetical protein